MTYASSEWARLRSRLGQALARFRYGISALDQVGLSVFSFALNLCLVRALSATDYGIVSLWMAMGLLSIGVQNAIVNGPLGIHVPAAADRAQARRLEEAIGIVNLLATGMTIAAIVAVNIVWDAEWVPHGLLAGTAIPVFIAASMVREQYRSLAFGRRDMAMLLWTDGPYLAVTTLSLAAMLVWPARFANLAGAFFAMSLGCIVSHACVRARFSFPRLRPLRRGWIGEYRAILGDVGWALVGVLASHLRSRSYVYVIVNLVSLPALAAINAVGILFRPVRMLMNAWARTAVPSMAADLAAGRIDAFDRMVAAALAAAIVGSAAWFVALWLVWRTIDRHFLAGNYPGAWALMVPWAVASAASVTEYAVNNALQAAREFKFLAYATLLAAPVTLAATIGVVLWQGYTWTMYGVALGNLVTFGVICGRLVVVRRRLRVIWATPRASGVAGAALDLEKP